MNLGIGYRALRAVCYESQVRTSALALLFSGLVSTRLALIAEVLAGRWSARQRESGIPFH